MNSRKGFWGKGAIDTISERLQKELPGLHGFSARNLRYMRTFYEEWSFLSVSNIAENNKDIVLAPAGAKIDIPVIDIIWHQQVPNYDIFLFIVNLFPQ